MKVRKRKRVLFGLLGLLFLILGMGNIQEAHASKVVVDPSKPIEGVKNNLIIPKEVSGAKANITVTGASKVQKFHVDPNKGDSWGNINFINDITKFKNLRYPSFQKNYGLTNLVIDGITSTTRITADYGKIGTYKGEKVNVKLVFSDIKHQTDTIPWKFHNIPADAYANHFYVTGYQNDNGMISKKNKRGIIQISDNLYSGFTYYVPQMNVQLVVTHDDGSAVNFDGDSFIGFNSLNPYASYKQATGEYAYYSGMNSSDWYITKDTVLQEKTSHFNSLKVQSGMNPPNAVADEWNAKHDVLGDPKFDQASVSFRIKGTNPLFVIGNSGYGQTWATLSTATIFSVVPDKPVKSETNTSGADINGKPVQIGDEVIYHVKQKVNTLGVDLLSVYSKFQLIDNLPKEIDYESAHVETAGNTKFDASGEVKYDATNHRVTYTANSDTLKNRIKYNGETYDLVIKGKVNDKVKDGVNIINTAKSIVDTTDQNTNEVVNTPPTLPSITKKIVQNGKEVNQADVNYDDPFTYKSYVTLPNPSKDTEFTITDDAEDMLDVKMDSIKVFDASSNKEITSTGKLVTDDATEKWSWTVPNNDTTAGKKLYVTFEASVKSDYADADKYVDANGNIVIPNVISLNTLGSNKVTVTPNLPPMNITPPRTGSNHTAVVLGGGFLLLGMTLGLTMVVYKKKYSN